MKHRGIYILLVLLGVLFYTFAYKEKTLTIIEENVQEDSTEVWTRPYPINTNFHVLKDSLYLVSLPLKDTIHILKGEELVVAEMMVVPEDSIDSIWIKVARDQESIGWIREQTLLAQSVPSSPVSQLLHLLSSPSLSYVLWTVFLLSVGWLIRKGRLKTIFSLRYREVYSIFPSLLWWVTSLTAVCYQSILRFSPIAWEQFYFTPTLSPFETSPWISVLLICLWSCILCILAWIEDSRRSKPIRLYDAGGVLILSICSYWLLISVWIYVAYLLFALQSFYLYKLLKIWYQPMRYFCGECGEAIQEKGICPHCGALNK